jgi:hypothetical protein
MTKKDSKPAVKKKTAVKSTRIRPVTGILNLSMQDNICMVGTKNIMPAIAENLKLMCGTIFPRFEPGRMEINKQDPNGKKSWTLIKPENGSLPQMKDDKHQFSIGSLMVQYLSHSQGKQVKAVFNPGKKVAIFPV